MKCCCCNDELPVVPCDENEYVALLELSGWHLVKTYEPINGSYKYEHFCHDCHAMLQHPALIECKADPVQTLLFFSHCIPYLVEESRL